MNPQLIHIPSLRTLTTRSLSRRDLEAFSRETNGSLDAEILGLCAVDEFLADFFEGRDLLGCEGDADLVGFLCDSNFLLVFYFVSLRELSGAQLLRLSCW